MSARLVLAVLLIAPAFAQAVPMDLSTATFTGTESVVVIPLQFQDVKGVTPPLSLQNLFFAEGGDERSVRDFLRETSSGKFALGGHVVPQWVTSSRAMAQYGNSESFGRNPALDPAFPPVPICAMVQEAIRLADPLVDFSKLAGPDGALDVVVLHAGTPEDYTGLDPDVWSQARVGGTPVCNPDGTSDGSTYDGVIVDSYMTDSEFSPIGTNAHELGHSLFALPDLYHGPNWVRGWDLMASGSWDGYATASLEDPQLTVERGTNPSHFGAYLKMLMGWTTVQTASAATGTYHLAPAAGATGVRVLRLDVQTNACSNAWTMQDGAFRYGAGSRFFLLEYRDADHGRYDGAKSASGVLAWYIDECAANGGWWEMNMQAVPRVRVIPSGTSYPFAAMPAGATMSAMSTWSSTVDGIRTEWFVNVVSLGDEATLVVGKSGADVRIVSPIAGPSASAAGRSQGGASAAYVGQTETRVTSPFTAAVWHRDTPARVEVTGAGGGFTTTLQTSDGATWTLSCALVSSQYACAVPIDAPSGEGRLVVRASDGSRVRELARPVVLV